MPAGGFMLLALQSSKMAEDTSKVSRNQFLISLVIIVTVTVVFSHYLNVYGIQFSEDPIVNTVIPLVVGLIVATALFTAYYYVQ